MFDGENRRYRMRNIYLLFCSTKGEEVYGVFKLKPNTRNVRDLDIEIDVDFQVKNMVTWSALTIKKLEYIFCQGELCQVVESNKYKMR